MWWSVVVVMCVVECGVDEVKCVVVWCNVSNGVGGVWGEVGWVGVLWCHVMWGAG